MFYSILKDQLLLDATFTSTDDKKIFSELFQTTRDLRSYLNDSDIYHVMKSTYEAFYRSKDVKLLESIDVVMLHFVIFFSIILFYLFKFLFAYIHSETQRFMVSSIPLIIPGIFVSYIKLVFG